MKWTETRFCLTGIACTDCRREGAQGEAFRAKIAGLYEMPGGWPACPAERGARPMGYVHVRVVPKGTIRSHKPVPPHLWPRRVKLVARFRRPDEVGVGDTLARMIGNVKGDKLAELFTRVTGKDCGCSDRQARLNLLYPY